MGKEWLRKHKVLLLILLIGLVVRVNRYELIPAIGETKDEITWTWAGLHILQGKGSGTFVLRTMDMADEDEMEIGEELVKVDTWLDNPPLFAFIPGGAAFIAGLEGFHLPDTDIIRLPMIVLGMVAVFLVYLVGKSWFGESVGLLASLFYATIPTMAITSRLAVAENLLIVWILLSMWLFRSRTDGEKNNWFLLGLVGGLALLTKLSGVALLAAVVTWQILEGKKETAIKIGITAVIIGLIYPLMGIMSGWENFMSVMGFQNLKLVGWSSWLVSIIRPGLVNSPFVDGWIMLGWIGLIFQLMVVDKKKENLFFNVLIVGWLTVVTLIAGQGENDAWYRYPLYPLMSLALAKMAVNVYKQKNFWALVPVGLLGLLPNLRFLLLFQKITVSNTFSRLGLFFYLFPLAILVFRPKYKLGKKVIYYLVLILSVAVNVFVTMNFSEVVLESEKNALGLWW